MNYNEKFSLKDYNHVIWDFNGTMVDDCQMAVDVVNKMLSLRSLNTVTVDEYKEIFDFPVKDYYLRLGLLDGDETFEELSIEYIDGYVSAIIELQLHDGLIRIMNDLKARNAYQYVISAAEDAGLKKFLIHLDIMDYLTDAMGIDDHYADGKTELGIRWMDINKPSSDEKTIFIGDTTHDFEVAEAMGADCLLIADGHMSMDRLLVCGCPVVNDLYSIES